MTSDLSGRPQTFLAGAELEQAKSVAMGSAASKGWRIVESADNRLVVERPIDAGAAQSVFGEPISSASVEVRTDFYERQQGVVVVTGAALIADRGAEGEKSVDFTDRYSDEIASSLRSLQNTWEQNRWRVAATTPPPAAEVAALSDEVAVEASATGPGGRAEEQDAESASGSAPAEITAWSGPPANPGSPSEPLALGASAPAGEESYAAAVAPSGPSGPAETGPASNASNMLTLNRPAQLGVWAYYAEHYAKIRGCAVSDSGAVLEEKQPEFEIHRVYCEDGQNILVKCNAGTCSGLQ